jgi:hypothetical protein
MEETRTGMPLTESPGAGTSGVSEPSLVEALVNPTSVFRHPQEVVHHPRAHASNLLIPKAGPQTALRSRPSLA